MRTILFALAVALALPAFAAAQLTIPGSGFKPKGFADVGEIAAEVFPAKAKPGEVVTLKITVTPKRGWYTYPMNVPTGQTGRNLLKPESNPEPQLRSLYIVGAVDDPEGWIEKTSTDRAPLKDRVYKQPATWILKAIVSPNAALGSQPVSFDGIAIQICDTSCLNAREADFPKLSLEVLPGSPVAIPAEYQAELNLLMQGLPKPPAPTPGSAKIETKEAPHTGIVKKKHLPLAEYQAKLDKLFASMDKQDVPREGGIAALWLTAAFWGLVSLATPCVFPMIPITVSLFLKQSNQSTAGAAKLAGVYCGTIVVVLGLSAVFLLSVFRALSVDPWMNLFLGGLFIVFALSLLGMYNLTLPNFLLRAAESKRKQGGMIGTVFGAVAFSIVSFTCVAPFLGGFAGMASSGQYTQFELLLAGLTFAGAFALPFFVLALFPSLLKKLPRSGGWMDTIKAVMGFLEVAAALKFFRTAELRWSDQPTYFTYDLVLAGWVIVALATGLYLLGIFRLPHDEEKSNLGVPRLIFAMLFLGFGIYLTPGLFKNNEGQGQRPGGVVFAWVDAFLLPEPATGSAELPWSADLPDAIDKARTEQKLVFVDFTGVTCSNCKANEREVFPKVRKQMEKYILVQMYTDDVPAEFFVTAPSTADRKAEGTKGNLEFQKKAFGTEQLPLYAIFEPTPTGAKVVAVYAEGKINDQKSFEEFLTKPLAK